MELDSICRWAKGQEAKNPGTFGSPRLTEDDATKVSKMYRKLPSVGDVEAALGGAEVAIDVEYATPTQHHNPIELFTTTCAWMDDKLTIREPSQFVYGLKNYVARRLAADPDKVEVVSPFVGGAFGSKSAMTPRTAMVALAAKRLNRPVKLVATRSQGFTISTYRAETRHHVRLGARRDGKLVGYAHEGSEISSRPDPYVVAGVADAAHLYAFGATASSSAKRTKARKSVPDRIPMWWPASQTPCISTRSARRQARRLRARRLGNQFPTGSLCGCRRRRRRASLRVRRDGKLVGYAHEGSEISSRPDPYVV